MPEGRRPLSELEQTTDFVRRHIGPGEAEIATMLELLGLSSLDELIERTVPAAIRDEGPSLAGGRTEARALADVRALASRNTVFKSMIGMGYHDLIGVLAAAAGLVDRQAAWVEQILRSGRTAGGVERWMLQQPDLLRPFAGADRPHPFLHRRHRRLVGHEVVAGPPFHGLAGDDLAHPRTAPKRLAGPGRPPG